MQKYCYNCMYPLEGASFCGHCGADCKAEPACATYHLPCGTALGGDYIVGRVLGEGGFGITYIGLQKTLSKRVAIKEFYPSGIAQRELFRINSCNVFRSDFAENQNDQREQPCHIAHHSGTQQINGQRRCQGCGGDVHEVISDQNTAEHLVLSIQNLHGCLRAADAVFSQIPDADAVYRGQSSLGG